MLPSGKCLSTRPEVNCKTSMPGYYPAKLAGERLRRCYEVAPPPARAYLAAEIDFVRSRLSPHDSVLELGCGYGRVLAHLVPAVRLLWGIDISMESLQLARVELRGCRTCHLAAMNATQLGFGGDAVDVVICIQNGISAFALDPIVLMSEALRVARPGGKVLFSSYAERFWEARLEWFEAQAAEGLIGPIDPVETGNGIIVGRDGFRATTVGPDQFNKLCGLLGVAPQITEVEGSSLFCEVSVP